MTERITAVDFHFDIMCPWAYQASLWMRDVRDQLGLEVRWRFFSLEEINRAEGKKHPWEREWSYGWSMMRVGALLRRIDPGTARPLVLTRPAPRCTSTAASRTGGRWPRNSSASSASTRPWSARRSATRARSEEVRADHDRVTGLGGWGVPTLVFAGRTRRAVRAGAHRAAGRRGGRPALAAADRLAGVPESVRGAAARSARPTCRPSPRPSVPTWRPRDWITIQKETP